MARKRRRSGKKGLIPKTMGGVVSLVFKVFGVVIAASPAVQPIMSLASGTPADVVGNQIAYNYTGFSPKDGKFEPRQTAVGIGTVVAGIVVAKLGSILGRHFH